MVVDKDFLIALYHKKLKKMEAIILKLSITFFLIILIAIPKVAFSKTEYLYFFEIDGFSDEVPFGKISAFTVYKNEIYVADSRRKEIFIFDLKGNPISSFGVENNLSGKPESLVISNEKVYITISGKNSIDVFNVLGKMISSIPAPYSEFKPGSIAAIDDSGILVFDKNLMKVCIFDDTGKLVSSFSIKDRLKTVSGIAYNNEKIFVASTDKDMAIHIFNMKGDFLSGFGRVGNSDSDFSVPSNIRFDNDGILWVVDGLKHRASSYNDKGELMDTITGKWTQYGSFDFPYDIFFAEDMVYVMETGTNRITVLKKDEKPDK